MTPQHLTLIDGEPATPDALTSLAFAGFAHFTATQVRDGRIRGLDLHLERLHAATLKLFDVPFAADELLERLRQALTASEPDLSVTVTVFDARGEFTNEQRPPSLRTLIRTGPPSDGPAGPLALGLVEHERFMPDIKHVGEGAKTFYMRRASTAGLDDMAFVDSRGRISEASIWNLAFFDNGTVVWPEAEALTGTMMSTVRRQLAKLGVPQQTRPITPESVRELDAAVVMNSWTPGVAVRRIGTAELPVRPDLVATLHEAHAAEPPVRP